MKTHIGSKSELIDTVQTAVEKAETDKLLLSKIKNGRQIYFKAEVLDTLVSKNYIKEEG